MDQKAITQLENAAKRLREGDEEAIGSLSRALRALGISLGGDRIAVGDISDSTGVAIGQNIEMVIHQQVLPKALEKQLDDLLKMLSSRETLMGHSDGDSSHASAPIPWEEVVANVRAKNKKHSKLLAEKYESDLYVERTKIREQVERFIYSSDAAYLILRGRSGMGKSGFLSNLERDLSHNPDIACLVFDSKSLHVVEETDGSYLLDLLAKGELPPPNEAVITKLMSLIESGAGFDEEHCRLVVIADAVNESKNMASVLKWLANLQSGSFRPWIKVIISCRPHVYRNVRNLMIASYGDSTDGLPKEYFFRPEGANRPYVEVPDFTEEEAEGAYRKHQRKFCLIPDHYAKLEEKMVRKRLREPLLLWLIANICRNGEIEVNQQLVGTDLSVIPEYTRTRLKTDDCVEDEYLDFKRFLEVTLPMKMIENGKCRNTVPSSDLQDEECQEKLQRLLRLGLLEHTTASGIGFRYERFYDYYFGLELRRKTAENTALECHPADDWRFYRNEHRK